MVIIYFSLSETFISADVNTIPTQAQNAPQSHAVGSPKQSSPSELVSPQSKEVSMSLT